MVTVPRDVPPWAQVLADDITREITRRAHGFPVALAPFPKADMPSASRWRDTWIVVTDDVGGRVPAFSDGTNWRRCTDRAVIS